MITLQANVPRDSAQVQDTRQIEGEMNLMAEQISCLEVGLKRLTEKLNPIICHQSVGEEPEKEKTRTLAPLAEIINGQSKRIRKLLDNIIYLEQTIQL